VSPRSNGTRYYAPVKCPVCGHDNRSGARFCRKCGFSFGKASPPSKPIPQQTRFKRPPSSVIKEAISKAFGAALVAGWTLFSLFLSIYLYSLLTFLGAAAFAVCALLFLHIFAPIPIRSGKIKQEDYGVITFLLWSILDLFAAGSTYQLVLRSGFMAALVASIVVWIISLTVSAVINKMFFGFPSLRTLNRFLT